MIRFPFPKAGLLSNTSECQLTSLKPSERGMHGIPGLRLLGACSLVKNPSLCFAILRSLCKLLTPPLRAQFPGL